MRPLHVAFATSIAAVIVTSWPANSAPAAAVMTQKQAALRGLTVTRNAREPRVDKLIVGLKEHRGRGPRRGAQRRSRAIAGTLGRHHAESAAIRWKGARI